MSPVCDDHAHPPKFLGLKASLELHNTSSTMNKEQINNSMGVSTSLTMNKDRQKYRDYNNKILVQFGTAFIHSCDISHVNQKRQIKS